MSENLQYLKKVALFSLLTPEQLEEVDKVVIERRYQKGRIIFVEGEPGEATYFLKSGRVKISKQAEDGREYILHFINPGEVFAEVVLFDGGGYPATAEVIEDAQIGMIRNSDMEKIVLQHPQIALALLKILTKRIREALNQINDLALNDAFRRLGTTLVKLAEQHGIEKPDMSVEITIPFTNQELASMIGTSRETVNRILSDLRKQKIIKVDKQKIIIINPQKLGGYYAT